jgi:hypothetical protein
LGSLLFGSGSVPHCCIVPLEPEVRHFANLKRRPYGPAHFDCQRAGRTWEGKMRRSRMADVRLVVVDLDDLQRMIVDAVRLATSERAGVDEWVDARSSGLGRRTFLRLVREGAFPTSKRGKTYVARRTDVDAYIERQRVEPSEVQLPPPPPSGSTVDPIAAALAEGRLRLVKKPP